MNTLKNSLLLGLCSIVLFGCGTATKITALKPEPEDASPLLYEHTVSYINMPVKIRLQDIENKLNTTLTGLVYEDSNIEDDDFTIKIWKLAPIQLENLQGKIRSQLPLKAQVKYRIGTNKLGIDLYTTKEFLFNGTLNLLSEVNLSNWKLSTKTEFKSLDWNESPSVVILGKAVPITYLINPGLRFFKERMEKSIDDAIEKSMDFKPQVLDALEKICTPFQMNESYESWLHVVPLELYSTNAMLQKENVSFEMGVKCNMETLIGQKPVSQFNRNKIALKAVSKIPDQLSANIVAVSTYTDASKIMTKNFAGKEFTSGKKKITVQNISLWHKDSKMIIAMNVQGSVNGTIYLSGFPKYNDVSKEIFFDQLDYVLDTKSTLLKTANWLAQGYILRKFQESCKYSIVPNVEEAKLSIQKYLKNYSPMQGVFVNGNLQDIEFQKIQLSNKAILAFIKVNGTVNITVDGFK